MKVNIHRNQFADIRPWQWWLEDDKGVINWGGREWTAEDAQHAAQDARVAAEAVVSHFRELLVEARKVINDACHATAIYGEQPPSMYLDALAKINAALDT